MRVCFSTLLFLVAACAGGGSSTDGVADGAVPGEDGGISRVPPGKECANVTVDSAINRPVDIVLILDSSPSMEDEAAQVQNNMNLFARSILDVGIDPHVVVITDRLFINVPDPLGSDTEHYRFIDSEVGSRSPLARLLSEYDHYSDFLRPDAPIHFIAITDDESNISAERFSDEMGIRLGDRPFTFHAIASPGGACTTSTSAGERYYQLADMTGGLKVSICTTDWLAVFTRLWEHITSTTPLPCSYKLPEPPDGSVLAYDRASVEYRDHADMLQRLTEVSGAGDCGGQGWYYDDPRNPGAIELCPASCTTVSENGGMVAVAFSCHEEID